MYCIIYVIISGSISEPGSPGTRWRLPVSCLPPPGSCSGSPWTRGNPDSPSKCYQNVGQKVWWLYWTWILWEMNWAFLIAASPIKSIRAAFFAVETLAGLPWLSFLTLSDIGLGWGVVREIKRLQNAVGRKEGTEVHSRVDQSSKICKQPSCFVWNKTTTK